MFERRDLLEDRRLWVLLWGAPQLAFLLGFFISPWRTGLWTVSLAVLGIACLLNASRCGRLHCYLTGPFYLLSAISVVLLERGWISLGSRGWLWLGLGIVIGGNLLTYFPERLWGKYVGHE